MLVGMVVVATSGTGDATGAADVARQTIGWLFVATVTILILPKVWSVLLVWRDAEVSRRHPAARATCSSSTAAATGTPFAIGTPKAWATTSASNPRSRLPRSSNARPMAAGRGSSAAARTSDARNASIIARCAASDGGRRLAIRSTTTMHAVRCIHRADDDGALLGAESATGPGPPPGTTPNLLTHQREVAGRQSCLQTKLSADKVVCKTRPVFRSNLPVTQSAFLDRAGPLRRLEGLIARTVAGAPEWLAIVGPRKVGKTSLLLEAARRAGDGRLAFVVFDVMDSMPVSPEVFRRLAGRVLDAVLGEELGIAPSRLVRRPEEFRAAVLPASRYRALPPDLQQLILEIPTRPMDEDLVRDALELPERLGQALDLQLLVAIDEFQELPGLAGRRGSHDPVPLMRSVWQRHQRVAYVISGSARTTLTELVTSERSPFFQHFGLMELGPFDVDDGIALLVELSPKGRRIPKALARRAVDVLGGHPFYLQVFGEELVRLEPPYDERSLKEVLQAVLFSRAGRLALYFQNEHERLVGKSTGLAATLDALADGPLRMTDVAKEIGASTGSTNQYLHRLGDAVRVLADGSYALDDPAFAAWVRWRAPGGTVVPMGVVGDEAERSVAAHLARMGFDLVYQSRASRGAFDLLAVRDAQQLGIQVKKGALPLRFSKSEWARMGADAKKLGWRWVVAAVGDRSQVTLLDPKGASKRKEVRVGENAAIENLLAWLE